MKIATTASACLYTPLAQHPQLVIFPQTVHLGTDDVLLDYKNLNRLRSGKQLVLSAATLENAMSALQTVPTASPIVFLTPHELFAASLPRNMLKSIAIDRDAFHVITMDCYGAALSYLVQAAVAFNENKKPTMEQLLLFIGKLSDSVKSYIITRRASVFEPRTSKLLLGLMNLLPGDGIYAITNNYPRFNTTSFKQELSDNLTGNTRIWIDSHRHGGGKWIQGKLNKWGVADKMMVQTQLLHRSDRFASRFTLLTLTPDPNKIQSIGDWALRWA